MRSKESLSVNKGVIAVAILLLITAAGVQAFRRHTPEEKRAKVMAGHTKTMDELYRLKPEAKSLIESSAGFATFSTKGLKAGVAGADHGKGVLIERATGKQIFMKMLQISVGLGYGMKRSSLVFVFEDTKAMADFVEHGWDFSGKAGAGVETKAVGGASRAGAVSFMPGVLVYQFTKRGLVAEIALSGTKFMNDKDLNEPQSEGPAKK